MATTKTPPAPQVDYSFARDLAASVPELANLLKEAAAAGWDVQRFTDKLYTTSWWKANSDTAKQMIDLKARDPAQYSQQVLAAQKHVEQMSVGLGLNLTHAQIVQQATADMFQGLDDATIQQQIGQLYKTVPGSGGGQSVNLNDQIKQLATEYGVPVTQNWIDGQVRQALSGNTGVEGAQHALIQMATSVYPPLAQQLAAGQTTTQIAQPYIAMMSQTLELPETGLTVQDPTIQRALQNPTLTPAGKPATSKPATTPALMPGSPAAPAPAATVGAAPVTLSDFQNQLRTDPRWDRTDNARQTAYNMAAQLGKSWGFSS